MLKFILFLILLFLCWPLAIALVLLYPIVWLLLLPFRLAGVVVGGVFHLVEALLLIPVRLVRAA